MNFYRSLRNAGCMQISIRMLSFAVLCWISLYPNSCMARCWKEALPYRTNSLSAVNRNAWGVVRLLISHLRLDIKKIQPNVSNLN